MVAHWEKNIVQKKYSRNQRSLSKLLGCWVKEWANETLEEYSIPQEQPLPLVPFFPRYKERKKRHFVHTIPTLNWESTQQDRCKSWISEGRGRKRLIIVEIQVSCLLVLCPQSPSIKFHINKIIQLLSISYHSCS